MNASGGRLAARGDVTLIGRPRVLEPIARYGLTVEARGGFREHVPPERLVLSESLLAVAGADVVLMCAKAGDTGEIARALAPHLDESTVVVGMQNGLHSTDEIREAVGVRTVAAGMVPFNVARTAPATYRRTIDGEIVLERLPAVMPFARLARDTGMPVRTTPDMPPVLHGKVLIALNNPIQALSGLPLRDELMNRDLRRCLSMCQAEAMRCFTAAGVVPTTPVGVPASMFAPLLRLPTPAFRVISAVTMHVDDSGTSSMADDLDRGYPTEIDSLQGEIVEMGERLGVPTPCCRRVLEHVRAAEEAGADRHHWKPGALLADLRAARIAAGGGG